MVYHNHMHSLLEWIDENIYVNLKIDDVAKKSGYSKWHLQRVFSLYTGMTLGHYIRKRRLCWLRMTCFPRQNPYLIYLSNTVTNLSNLLPEHSVNIIACLQLAIGGSCPV